VAKARAGRPILDRGQLNQLESVLGEAVLRELRPAFEQAVLWYRADGGKTSLALEQEVSDTARKHVRLAENAKKRLVQLNKALEALNATTKEASSLGYVDLTPVLTLGTMGLPLDAQPQTWAGLSAKATLEAVSAAVRTWESRAAADVPRRRGRKIGDRVRLAEWVGIRLARTGVRPTKSADGKWARTLSVLYEAAGAHVPLSLYPDIAAAHEYLKRNRPELLSLPRTTKSR
jgi:hypothetical protein